MLGDARTRFATGLVLIVAGLAGAGCGSASGGDEQQTYAEVLQGLRKAALAGKAYDAVERARGLPPAEREAIRSFCEFAWQIGVNREAEVLDEYVFVVKRLITNAFRESNAEYRPLRASIGQLDETVGLAKIDAPSLERYAKACEA